ncbi:MAG: helix-turn-helix domain-containing protein [Verrucomicrobiota bacterium]
MSAIQTNHETSMGWRVWWMRKLSVMGRAHTHADVEVNIPMHGGPLRYLHAGRIVEVPTGKLALFWGGIPHQLLSPASGCEGIWITLPLPWILQWEIPKPFTQRLLSGDFLLGPCTPEESAGLRRWVADFESGNADRRKVLLLEIQARLHRLALEMPRRHRIQSLGSSATGEARMEAITHHINTHYLENVTVREIADAVGLNHRYMMRLFQAHSAMSVWEYVVRLRVSHAQRLLITTNQKITDIALESGFGSVAPFYAAFEKFGGGKTPTAFRQAHR